MLREGQLIGCPGVARIYPEESPTDND